MNINKLMAGNRMIPVEITKEGERLYIKFQYNPKLLEEIKAFDGAKWHGYDEKNPRKIWSVRDSARNRFRLNYLAHPSKDDPFNPFNRYNASLIVVSPTRNVFDHQKELIAHNLTRKQCIIAGEPGTGKTLAAIETMEQSKKDNWFYVGPKSALVSVKLEFLKWRSKVTPRFLTYEGLTKLLTEWSDGIDPPNGVIFDEASRLKNPTAKRSIAAQHLADAIRERWADQGYVILMSGTPAPKSPIDWWKLAEIACPGFLKEGNQEKFKKRLAIIEQREQFAGGGAYPHLVGWYDDDRKCKICGLMPEAETHSNSIDVFGQIGTCHKYEKSVNEVALLFQRMAGLTIVKLKKDVLDLPDKFYKEIVCTPTRSMLNAAKAIQARSTSTIQALINLRELSDGFQYIETVDGITTCDVCKGFKTLRTPILPDNYDPNSGIEIDIEYERTPCNRCDATGQIAKIVRSVKQVPCPKDDALKELMDEYDEIGRMVVYGGFQGTIERLIDLVKSVGWNYIKVDGKGWSTDLPFSKPEDMVVAFQSRQSLFPRVCFIGQPAAAGMGLTLTASPVIVYYSNDFNGESRAQSEERIHRPGMDTNRGATIIDLLHLPTDKLVLNNLKKKKDLQNMSLGVMKQELDIVEQEMTATQIISRIGI